MFRKFAPMNPQPPVTKILMARSVPMAVPVRNDGRGKTTLNERFAAAAPSRVPPETSSPEADRTGVRCAALPHLEHPDQVQAVQSPAHEPSAHQRRRCNYDDCKGVGLNGGDDRESVPFRVDHATKALHHELPEV